MPVEKQVLVVRGARDLVSGRHGGPRFVGRSNVQHAGRAVLTLGALCVMIERPLAKWRRSAAGPASLPAWLPDDECVRRACHCLCTQPMPRVVLAGQQGGAGQHGAVLGGGKLVGRQARRLPAAPALCAHRVHR